MKTIAAGLLFLVTLLALSIAALRPDTEPLRQQDGEDYCAIVSRDNCVCGPSPGIIVTDRMGMERQADWNCHCWVVR